MLAFQTCYIGSVLLLIRLYSCVIEYEVSGAGFRVLGSDVLSGIQTPPAAARGLNSGKEIILCCQFPNGLHSATYTDV